MNTVSHKKVHNLFKLNGIHFDRDDLCMVAYSFIKEGLDFQKSVGDFLLDWFDDKPYIDMNTSGTTGDPKGVFFSHRQLVLHTLAVTSALALAPVQGRFHHDDVYIRRRW